MAKAAEKQDTKEAAKVAPEAAPSKKGLIIKIVIAVIVLGAAGGGAAWYMMKKQGDAAAPAAEVQEEEKPASFTDLDTFTVNLQPENGDQYLQIGLSVKLTDPKSADVIKQQMPEIRNRILLLLSGKKASEIATVDGKRKLGEELLGEIRKPVTSKETRETIKEVLLTSFIIQ